MTSDEYSELHARLNMIEFTLGYLLKDKNPTSQNNPTEFLNTTLKELLENQSNDIDAYKRGLEISFKNILLIYEAMKAD